jgi:hypothetical protein
MFFNLGSAKKFLIRMHNLYMNPYESKRIKSSGFGLEFGLTSGQNGAEREKETEGKGAKECSTGPF